MVFKKIIFPVFSYSYSFFEPIVSLWKVAGFPLCMKQNYDSSAFRNSPGGYFSDFLTQDVCKQLCSDFKFPFVGLIYGEYCLCSNHTSDLEEVDSDLCNKACSANEDDICGSEDVDIVYVLEAELMGSVDSIIINIDDESIFTDKAVKISLDVEATTDFFVVLQFGDGTSHKFTSEPYEIEKFYRIPGEYVIHVTAVDIAQFNPPIFERKIIEVEDKNLNFDVNCPYVVEPKSESQCNITFILGSLISMSFKMQEDADESDTLDVPDPFYVSLGPSISPVPNEDEYFSIVEKEIYLSYASIQFKSHLLGFEFLVKETGSLKLMVLTPSCSSDRFCEETLSCSSTCSDYNIRTCSDDEALCSYISHCVNPDDVPECKLKSSYSFDYEVKYTFDASPDSVGYNYYEVEEPEKYIVTPGDIIGFKVDDSSALWCRNVTSTEQENLIEDKSSDGDALGVRHFLRAILTEPVKMSLKYMYNDTRNQTISVQVSNAWSDEPIEKNAYLPVQTPISGVSIGVNSINVMVGENVFVNIKIINGSDVNILWDILWDPMKEESFKGDVPEEGYSQEIICNYPGDYEIHANISNLWSHEVISTEFHCFSSISRDWTLDSDSPKAIPPGEIIFKLKFDGEDLPTSAQHIVNFGDDSTSDLVTIKSDSNSWEEFTHQYNSEGNFTVTVNISNPVDFEIFELTVQIYEKMGELSVIPYYVTTGSYPDDRLELKDPNSMFAPKGSTVYFENTISGHISKYIMDRDLVKESTKNVISHKFSEVGLWQISFKAYSSELDEYSNEVLLKVIIVDTLSDFEFSASKTSVVTDEDVEFIITLEYIDFFTCIVFNGADDSQSLAFGNEMICELYYSQSNFKYIQPSLSDKRKKRDVTEAEWMDDKTIRIIYRYAYGGEFEPFVDVFNPVSRASKTLTVTVADSDYLLPLVWIDENSTDITKPLVRQRGVDFRMETTAIFRDNESYVASHIWSAFKVDNSGVETEEIDLIELITYNCSAVRITKRFLDYGLYKFKYTLTVYEELDSDLKTDEEEEDEEFNSDEIYDDYYTKQLHSEDDDDEEEDNSVQSSYENKTVLGKRTVYTYLQIIPTPLIPVIFSGGASYIVRGFEQTVTLEPTIYTVDPDYPDNEEEYKVKWFCTRYQKENLNEISEHEYGTDNPSSPIIDRSSVKEENDEGGCFGKGPGLMEIGSSDYKLKCNTLWGFDIVYEITAVISKGNRVVESHLLLEVIEKNPPSLQVMCERRIACFPQMQGQFINPNSYILLKAVCLEDCGNEGELSFQWTVYESDLKTFEKIPIEGWESHTQMDMDRMGLNQSLFVANPDTKIFLVEVEGSLPDPDVPKGVSSIFLIINNPPDKGDCKISTTSGIALIDTFTIEFSNWDDKDGHYIADYSIYVKYGDESLRLSYGLKTNVPVVLPYGDLQIWCSIQDNIGGVTMYSAANFSTSLPTEEELDEYENKRFFERCLAEGKMSLASQIVIAKNSILMEYRRRRNQEGDFAIVTEAEIDAKWKEFLEQDGIDSSYFTTQARDEIREMLTEQLEKQQDKDARAKNKEIGKMLRLPMEALPDAEIFGGALSAVAENGPSDMSAKGVPKILKHALIFLPFGDKYTAFCKQRYVTALCKSAQNKKKLMRGMDTMFNVINHTEVPHPENLKIVISQFGSLADSIAGSLADSNIGGHFIPAEMKKARLELDHNATEPNYFILFVEGNRKEVQEKLYDRTIDAAKSSQEDNAKEMVSKMKEMVSSIQQECMEGIIVGPEPFYTESKNGFQMTLLKNYASNLTGAVIQQVGSSVILPNICEALQEGCDNEDVAFGIQSVRWSQPLESYGAGSDNLSEHSNVIQIDITPRDGTDVIKVQNSSEPFTICIPNSGGSETQKKMENVVPEFSRADDIVVYHTTFIDSVGVVVTVNIVPSNVTAPLVLLFKYGEQPSLLDYDQIIQVKDIPSENGVHTLIIGTEFISEPGRNLTVAIGHFANTTDVNKFFENPNKYNLTVVNMTNEFTSNYSIAIAVTGCYYFNEGGERWSTEGCKVSKVESGVTCCECNHLTSFGSGFFVAPNSIDFNYVFAHADFMANKSIYATLIVMFSVFIILLIYARWKDRKDVEKLGATPLPDNEASDKYIYEILVFTGHQRNAGTKSNVFFIASGEDDETEVRHLADDKRPILQTSSVDVFVMTVPQSLGQLNYLRIWHDNSGTGKWSSWYCQYIVFRDVQTGLKYEFLVNQWFAVEHGDGLIDRLIPVAGREQVTEFSHLFSTNSRRNLADRHLWFSVFLRPPRSRFTRVQRVCCCMAVLCLSMLANAMYYQRTAAKPNAGGFKFGPFSLSPEQIAVGLICNFIVFPPTFIMIFFFRKSRPRKLRPSRLEEALKKQRREWKEKNPEKINTSNVKPDSDTEAQLYHRKRKFALPWWCVYFGWLMVLLSIGASLFFIWAYGIEFGDEKTSKWLTSLVIAFFSSVLLTQPMKVVLMAIVVSCICRSMDYDEEDADEDEEDPHLQPDEEYLHNGKRTKKVSYRPMDLEALEEARKEREKEIKMYSVLQEMCAYFFFLWVIIILSYGNRDPSNFYLREALVNGFIKPGDLWVEYNNVNTEKKFWNWTYNALVPELFAMPWYNGRDPLGLRLFLDDRNNLKIGYAVLRQVRIKPRSCTVSWMLEHVTPECAGYGGMFFEDGTLYTKGWRTVNSSDALVPPEYKYLSASQLKGYPFWGQVDWYGGGGYVVPLVSRRDSDITQLLRKLKRLEVDGWIDRHTRAVFVEFGTYNAQINLFCAVTILAEFLPGGGVIPYYHIDPVRLLNYHTGFGFFQLIIEIVFVIFTVFFTYREGKKICKQGLAYFKEHWNVAEFVSLVVSYTAIANHVYKLFMVAEILRIFTETEGTGYVKLQEAVLLNELFCYQIGLIMSISTLKFLKLLRFNKRIGVLSSTLKMCTHELKSYSVCLMVVFIAFVILFWLLLGRYMKEFSTFVYSFESCISMMLKKFNYDDMYAAQPIFTPIAFFMFSLATAVVLINILLSIIIRSFETVKHDASLQSNEYEILDYFINRMKMLLGCGTSKVRPVPSMYRDQKKPVVDTVSSFPGKVDKLVDFINDFYFDNQMDFNSKEFLKKMNADVAGQSGKIERSKKKAKPVMKSKIPKMSDSFDDF